VAFGIFGIHTLFFSTTVVEEFSASDGRWVATGLFHDVLHKGQSGEARIYRTDSGGHLLRLENLSVDNGPNLHVYVLAAEDATDNQTVQNSRRLELGALKGNKGGQTYPLPAEFDPSRHRAVTVWCRRFGVNFATAPLKPAKGS